MKRSVKDSLHHGNDYYLACDKVGQQQKYSICLMMIAMGRDSNFEKSFESCKPFLCDGTCPAMVMRKEEMAKGEAIYFQPSALEAFEAARRLAAESVPDDKPMAKIDKNSLSYQRGFTGQTPSFSTSHARPAKMAKGKRPVEPPSESLESMLVTKLSRTEKEVQRAQETKVVAPAAPYKPAKAPALTLLPGEKPIDFAKRLREARRIA